jgi:hypothetical protein
MCDDQSRPSTSTSTPTKNKKLTSTEYYRINRENKSKTYRCPHENCNYETHNSKSALVNHINAKHTPEKNKPFQCSEPGCNRGFAQKSHLINHIKNVHKKDTSKLDTRTTNIIYEITLTDKIPKSKSTIARREFYRKHPVLKSCNLFKKKYIYGEDKYLKNHDLHYDQRKDFIILNKKLQKEKKYKKIKNVRVINNPQDSQQQPMQNTHIKTQNKESPAQAQAKTQNKESSAKISKKRGRYRY